MDVRWFSGICIVVVTAPACGSFGAADADASTPDARAEGGTDATVIDSASPAETLRDGGALLCADTDAIECPSLCCVESLTSLKCVLAQDQCNGVAMACRRSQDCGGTRVCCLVKGQSPGTGITVCKTACSVNEPQLCDNKDGLDNHGCPNGGCSTDQALGMHDSHEVCK